MGTETAQPSHASESPLVSLRQDSLRTRKRAATILAIRHAAIELGLEQGYENVTVDMICAASSISPRTFFNYFGNKEGAYVGAPKPMPPPEQLKTFVEDVGTSVFVGLFSLFTTTFIAAETDLELLQAWHRLIHLTPELLEREKARINATEETFVGYVLARFQHDGRTAAQTPDLEDEARMVVALVSGALRFAVQKWAAGNFAADKEELMRSTSALVQRIAANEHWP